MKNSLCLFLPGVSDIVLLKFDSSGSLLWTRETGTSSDDYGQSVSVTAEGSSIYVTGYSYASLNGQPYAGGKLYLIYLRFV